VISSYLPSTVHMGIHKTGSTFMQRHFFPLLAGARYLPLRTTHRDFLRYLLYADDFVFTGATARDMLLANLGCTEPTDAFLLSDEQLYGSPWDGAALRRRNAERLAAALPGSRIVVVLRNQRALLQSLYLQYIKTGGSAHWSQFLAADRHPLITSISYYRFAEYLHYLFRLFGRQQVAVFLYEDFLSDATSYLNGWCDFLGLSRELWDRRILDRRENISLSPRAVPLMRLANKFTSSLRRPYSLFPRAAQIFSERALLKFSFKFRRDCRKPAIPIYAAEEFLRGCHDSNHLLEELLGRSLRGLGYPGID